MAYIITEPCIGTKDTVGQAVAGLMNRRSIALDDPSLRHLSVFPLDEAWSRAAGSRNPKAGCTCVCRIRPC